MNRNNNNEKNNQQEAKKSLGYSFNRIGIIMYYVWYCVIWWCLFAFRCALEMFKHFVYIYVCRMYVCGGRIKFYDFMTSSRSPFICAIFTAFIRFISNNDFFFSLSSVFSLLVAVHKYRSFEIYEQMINTIVYCVQKWA